MKTIIIFLLRVYTFICVLIVTYLLLGYIFNGGNLRLNDRINFENKGILTEK